MPKYARRPYRRTYKRRSYTSRGKPPVPKKRKTTRSYVRSNAIATRVNSRRISSLWNKQFGPLQRNLHINNAELIINCYQPIAFDASDFTCAKAFTPTGSNNVLTTKGCHVWQPNLANTAIDTASKFHPPFNTGESGSLNINALWASDNLDIPDGGRYKPIRADYQLEIIGKPKIDDVWVQIDLFTQHHGFQSWEKAIAGATNKQRVMPDALINMGRMIDQNELNPAYFKRYKRIRVYLNSQSSAHTAAGIIQDGNRATTGNTKYVKFTVRPKKVRQQLYTTPQTPGTIENDGDQTDHGTYGSFQVDPRTPLWCMVSTTDVTGTDGDSVKINIKRHVVWRDINGGTGL